MQTIVAYAPKSDSRRWTLENEMKTHTVLALLILAGCLSAHGQDDILRVMTKQAELIARVEVLDLAGGMIEEAGVENWTATCRVLTPIKGTLKQDDKIKIDCSRVVFKEKEPLRFEKEREYIVFLRPTSWGVYVPIDHWVGILPSNLHILERTQKLAKETAEVQQ